MSVSRRSVERGLTNEQRLALGWSPYPGVDALVDDCASATVDALLREHGGPVWDAASFERLRDDVRHELPDRLRSVLAVVARICAQARAVERRLDRLASPRLQPSLEDVAGQLGGLVHDGFVSATRVERLDDVERYLRAAVHRLDRLPDSPLRDRQAMAVLERVQDRYAEALAANPPGGPADAELERVGWLIEELRVSLFAQPVGTPVPVSEQRITRALTALRR